MLAKIFPANEHRIERVLRVVLGLSLLSLAFIGPKSPWAFLALVPIVTGLLGSCPLYTVFGFSTCTSKVKAASHAGAGSEPVADLE